MSYFVPITLTRVELKFGEEPKVIEEERNLYFTNDSVRKIFHVLGVDFKEMLKRAKQNAAKKNGKAKKSADEVLFEGIAQLETDDFEQMAAFIWGGLIEEDPDLKFEDVKRGLTAANIATHTAKAMEALAIWKEGPEAGKKVREAFDKEFAGEAGEGESGNG